MQPDETSETFGAYAELIAPQSPYLFFDTCDFYPLEPVHGHFIYPNCHIPTKYYEGGPLDL